MIELIYLILVILSRRLFILLFASFQEAYWFGKKFNKKLLLDLNQRGVL
jgi:hypothetical protein